MITFPVLIERVTNYFAMACSRTKRDNISFIAELTNFLHSFTNNIICLFRKTAIFISGFNEEDQKRIY